LDRAAILIYQCSVPYHPTWPNILLAANFPSVELKVSEPILEHIFTVMYAWRVTFYEIGSYQKVHQHRRRAAAEAKRRAAVAAAEGTEGSDTDASDGEGGGRRRDGGSSSGASDDGRFR
jgi:hypothetical protein